MSLVYQLESRLALPDDTQVERRKKLIAWVAGVAGAALTLLVAILYFSFGLPQVALLHLGLVVFMMLPISALLLYPRSYYAMVFLTSAVVTIYPWLTHLATGGFQSGILSALWSLFGPISALFLIGPAPALVDFALLVALAAAATGLDSRANAAAPPVSAGQRNTMGLFNLVGLSAMVFGVALLLLRQLEEARAQADALLLNILPAPVAAKLKQGRQVIAESHPNVTVLFADIIDFTRHSAETDPVVIVNVLNDVFSDLDDLTRRYGLEKIKTIGDAYMVVGGLPQPRPDHCEAVAAYALEMMDLVKRHCLWTGDSITLRVGIATGPVVAGVIGNQKFSYDLWGDVVNTASRMETYGLPDAIQVTEAVHDCLQGRYQFERRGPIPVKGKGEMVTYLLTPLPAREEVT